MRWSVSALAQVSLIYIVSLLPKNRVFLPSIYFPLSLSYLMYLFSLGYGFINEGNHYVF